MSSNKTNVIIAALAVLVIGGGAYLVFANMRGGLVTRKSLELREPRQVAPEEATLPKIVNDPKSGSTYVSYAMPEGEEGANVFLKRSTDGGESWSEPVQVSQEGKMAARESTPQQMAIGPDGEVYVLWYNKYTENNPYEFGKGVVMFARSLDGGESFDEPVSVGADVENTTASNSFQNLTVADDGTVYVAVLHSASPESDGRTIRVASSKDGGQSWSDGTDIDTGACPCCRPSLETDSQENLYVGWRKVYDSNGGTTIRDNVVARSADGGQTWSEPVKYFDHGWKIDGCPHAGPSIGLDNQGRLHASWFNGGEGDEFGLGIYHSVSTDNGQSWSEPTPVFTSDYAPVAQPTMLIDSADNAWIIYDDLRSSEGEEKEHSGGHGSNDSTASKIKLVQITADGEKITYPDTAINGKNGDLAELGDGLGLVWKDKDGQIYFSAF